ncbi:MAG: hypothetical protein IKQ60_04845 [Candidatus Methanomethylophilaceae archaeon]|nr:hypothetical protein [Candidatus Methanomethylophilaceae archaeon]
MFTAIVLTFTGGAGFLTGSISGADNVETFKLVFLLLLCGFVTYNLLLLLLSVVERVAGMKLMTSEEGYKRMVIWFNAIIIIMMMADLSICICWHHNIISL